MSLPRYAEYKDSGVDWLERVPAHWETVSLKWVCQRYSGGTPDKKRLDFWEEGTIPWLNSGAVNDGRIYEASAFITQAAFESSSAKWIPPKALLMALAGQGKTKGMVAQLMFPATCNQSMAAIVPSDRTDARCLYWWLVSNYQNIRNMAGGDLRDGLNLDLLGAIPCPLPPLDEQTNISTFLDRETAKIDTLIAEQEKLIALLAEKRQATISHAVTRGLNPDVPMKDSGVDWLGEIPEHWQLIRLKFVVQSIEQGWSPQCENFPVEFQDEWGVLKIGCVNGGVFQSSENKKLPPELEPRPEYALKKGDLLISRANTRELVGSAAVVPSDFDNLMLCDKLYRLRLVESKCSPMFIAAYLGTPEARSQIELAATGASSSMLNIGQSVIMDMLVPLPAIDEQRVITAFIARESARLVGLMGDSKLVVELLKERRSALIAAAVTGQIDVRNT